MPAARPDIQPDFSSLRGLRHVALAVSGGSDSMALLRLAQEWAGSVSDPPKLTALTVDHRLRPASAVEARKVAGWASALGIGHAVLPWAGPKPQSSVQVRAREARYGLMTAWCREHGAAALLTAHTLDDQAETVLMRLKRTKSPASLSGIPRRGAWDGLPVLRPLLGERRAALRDYLAAIGQAWIDDPSNEDSRFERVRVRQSLAQLDRDGVTPERLAKLAERCAAIVNELERAADSWILRFLQETEFGVCVLPREALLELPKLVEQQILSRIVFHYGGSRLRPEREELVRLVDWLRKGTIRCTLAGAVLGRRKDSFWITREAARIDPLPLTIREDGKAVWDNRFEIVAPPGSRVMPGGRAPPEPGTDVPVFARKAYPRLQLPVEAAEEGLKGAIRFLRLKPS